MEPIHVAICSFSGQRLEVDMDRQRTISDVKMFIAGRWKIPEVFQRLISGTAILQDRDCLAACPGANESPLHITMLLSMEEVQKDLDSKGCERKARALGALECLGRGAFPGALNAAAACLEDRNKVVQLAAVSALLELAQTDEDSAEMHSALQALVKLAERGVRHVKCAAVEAVARLARKGDQRVITAYARTTCKEVAITVIKTLVQLTTEADQHVITAVAACLAHRDGNVRYATVEALKQLAKKRDHMTKGRKRKGWERILDLKG
eukprot:gnl/TRDRNA2_/TRDRNA2_42972_c0_seq1.p1 gnl/TRDRNA2_/TRDRNA2_42972_c0~~gnl/TRDRNA2_/TRDRNA2_42972_c0_seq1.p1  ORF type:complete len:266 (+),score=52.91 gnl/TRDRNA2_/TRDRNA2_42972_c0_seq1:74-871(+)